MELSALSCVEMSALMRSFCVNGWSHPTTPSWIEEWYACHMENQWCKICLQSSERCEGNVGNMTTWALVNYLGKNIDLRQCDCKMGSSTAAFTWKQPKYHPPHAMRSMVIGKLRVLYPSACYCRLTRKLSCIFWTKLIYIYIYLLYLQRFYLYNFIFLNSL